MKRSGIELNALEPGLRSGVSAAGADGADVRQIL